MRPSLVALALAAALVLPGCGSGPTEPEERPSGTLSLRWYLPAVPDLPADSGTVTASGPVQVRDGRIAPGNWAFALSERLDLRLYAFVPTGPTTGTYVWMVVPRQVGKLEWNCGRLVHGQCGDHVSFGTPIPSPFDIPADGGVSYAAKEGTLEVLELGPDRVGGTFRWRARDFQGRLLEVDGTFDVPIIRE